jgi:hypothetical protein
MADGWELEQARKDAKKLEAAGYTLQHDRYGYFLLYKGKGLGGARVLGYPKMNSQNAKANVRDNFLSCVRMTIKHAEENKIEWRNE